MVEEQQEYKLSADARRELKEAFAVFIMFRSRLAIPDHKELEPLYDACREELDLILKLGNYWYHARKEE